MNTQQLTSTHTRDPTYPKKQKQQYTEKNPEPSRDEKKLADAADSDVLLNRYELERMLQKARLEGAIGYITFLFQVLDEKKIRTLDELDQTVRNDWGCACSAAGALMMETLLFDGYGNGLMANIPSQEKQEPEKQFNKQ
ncbi:MAG: hypothetical protein ACFCUE_09130 [Candidatus Bathyarchaeia archaeon]|jgi:hypothetical protein